MPVTPVLSALHWLCPQKPPRSSLPSAFLTVLPADGAAGPDGRPHPGCGARCEEAVRPGGQELTSAKLLSAGAAIALCGPSGAGAAAAGAEAAAGMAGPVPALAWVRAVTPSFNPTCEL